MISKSLKLHIESLGVRKSTMNFCHKLTLSGSMASRRVLSVEDLLACITFAFERKFMKVTPASNVENILNR